MAIGWCTRRPNGAVRDIANGLWVEGLLGRAMRTRLWVKEHNGWIKEDDAATGYMKPL